MLYTLVTGIGHLNDCIAKVHTEIINISYLSGYSPTRWQRDINMVLEKQEG